MELEALLASGIFSKSSVLAQLLTYICNKYFEGATSEIKEYNIGVEALGRPPEFDQKKESIVRVEAHRLRRRLREYYEGEGAEHPVHIVLPPGQYVPQFVFAQPEARAEAEPEAPPVVASDAPPPPFEQIPAPVSDPPGHWRWWSWAMAAVVVAVAGIAAVRIFPSKAATAGRASLGAASDLPMPVDSAAIRIHVGSEQSYTDRSGHEWGPDRYFEGGWVSESHQQIAGTRDPRLYQTRREGPFRYDIPLKPGSYEMRLHFAETVYGDTNVAGGGESSRVFSVFANGVRLVMGLDVISDVGPNTADVWAFKDISPAPDGKLHLTVEQHSNAPILSGIEIVPSTPGRIWPIRLVSQDRAYVDRSGHTWEPDGSAKGGQLVTRMEDTANSSEPELYRGERFGNIQYAIPVPPGKYGIVFHFTEAWFGPANPGQGGAGSRLFDIFCNGAVLKRGLDVFQEAGGANRAFMWTAHGLEPNQQGKLIVSLVPVKNYAEINALEVVDESQ